VKSGKRRVERWSALERKRGVHSARKFHAKKSKEESKKKINKYIKMRGKMHIAARRSF